jgi:kumamolisin
VALKSGNPGLMDRLAVQVSTPSSALYRHYLRPGQVRARFGANPVTRAALSTWLRSVGLTVRPTSGDGLLAQAEGSVATIDRAFSVQIRLVRLADGQVAYANATAPLIPARLRGSVAGVIGLDNLAEPGSSLDAVMPVTNASATRVPATRASACCRDFHLARRAHLGFTPRQLAHAYGFSSLYRRGTRGQGMMIALVELADFATSDVATYARCNGVRLPAIKRVRVDGGTTIAASGGNIAEATADIETVLGMAPGARILVYEAPPARGIVSLLASYAAIVSQDRAQVASVSYDECEGHLSTERTAAYAEQGLFAAMALQGQSMLAAAGDSGSESCLSSFPLNSVTAYRLAVNDPASDPYVTAVGGTAIVKFGAPPVETVWNQTGRKGKGTGFRAPFHGRRGNPAKYPGNLAGGGGLSRLWRMPPWQRGFDTSGNVSGRPCHGRRGTTCREVPDVSALANGSRHDSYLIYGTAGAFNGKGWQLSGGTSLASPLWAALAALADQQTRDHRLGLLSPALYQIDRADPVAFHDVTVGGNNYLARRGFPNNYHCRYQHQRAESCYRATKGYDMATGLGTPYAARLVSDLSVINHRNINHSVINHRPRAVG